MNKIRGSSDVVMPGRSYIFYCFIVINIILVDVFHDVTQKKNSNAITIHTKIVLFGLYVSKEKFKMFVSYQYSSQRKW